MSNIRKMVILVIVAAVVGLGAAGCRSGDKAKANDHPSAEHSKGEHPKGEHPKGEHPKH